MNEKADRILAAREAAMETGARDMWRNTLADTVIHLLDAGEPISRDTLRQAVEAQIAVTENRYLRSQMLGTLNVLNGRLPRD